MENDLFFRLTLKVKKFLRSREYKKNSSLANEDKNKTWM